MNYEAQKPKLIIYDWDNTLADTTEIVTRVVNRLRLDCGKEAMSSSEILKYTGDPDYDWVRNLFGGKSDEMAKSYSIYYNQENNGFVPTLLFGAKKVLQAAKDMSIAQAVLTNKDSILAVAEGDATGVMDYFIAFFGKDDVPRKKPYPDGIEKIATTYNKMFNDSIKKEEIWFIGDTMMDIAAAKNYGCHAFFVGHESWITEKYKDYQTLLGNLEDLVKILENF